MGTQAVKIGTREQILDVAERLMAERGYHGASLRDIGQEVGIANASLLYHFPSKSRLHGAIIARIAEDLDGLVDGLESSAGKGDGKLRAVIDSLTDWASEHPRWARLLLRELVDQDGTPESGEGPLASRLINRIGKLLAKEGKDAGLRKIDPALLMIRILGSTLLFSIYAPRLCATEQRDMKATLDAFRKQERQHLARALEKGKSKVK